MAITTPGIIFFGVMHGTSTVAIQTNPATLRYQPPSGITDWVIVDCFQEGTTTPDLAAHFALTSDSNPVQTLTVDNGLPDFLWQSNARILCDINVAPFGMQQIPVDLRTIGTLDALFVRGAETAPITISGPPPPTFSAWTWSATPKGALIGASITLSTVDATSVTMVVTDPPSWNVDGGLFDLTIGATSTISSLHDSVSTFDGARSGPLAGQTGASQPTLALRALDASGSGVLDGYSFVRGHVAGGTAINAALPAGFTATGVSPNGLSAATTLTTLPFDASLRISALDETAIGWGDAGTFTLEIVAASNLAPTVRKTGLQLEFRELMTGDAYSLALPYRQTAGTTALELGGPAVTWLDVTEDLAASTLAVSADNRLPYLGSTLQLAWGAHGLSPADTGAVTMTVRAASGFPDETSQIQLAIGPDTGSPGGCSCSAPDRPASGQLALTVLAVSLALGRRRRRGRNRVALKR